MLNHGDRIARYVELNAPTEICAAERTELITAIDALEAALRAAPLPAELLAACGVR